MARWWPGVSTATGQSTGSGGLTGVTAIAAGGWHSMALKSDGTVVAWGAAIRPDERTGGADGRDGHRRRLVAQPGAEERRHGGGLGLRSLSGLGTMHGAGGAERRDRHRCGRLLWREPQPGAEERRHGCRLGGQRLPPAGLSGVTAIAAGNSHSLALKADGTVVAWGSNFAGETTVPAGLTGVTAIAAGTYHSLAIVHAGSLTVNAGGPYSVNEGASVVVTASANDPDGDTLTYAWDLDNDGTFETTGQSATFQL